MRCALASITTFVVASSRLAALDLPGQALDLQRSRGGLPIVIVQAGAETLRFAIDTGTSRSMVSADIAARLRLLPREAFRLASAGGKSHTALCATPPELRLGGVRLAIACLGWVPRERRLAGAEDVDGLLGADALAGVDLWLDDRRDRARLAPAGSLTPWVTGVLIPLEPVGQRPVIRLELPALGRGTMARVVVDSGATGVLLFGALARRANAMLRGSRQQGLMASPTASGEIRFVALGSVRGGDRSFEAGWTGLLPETIDRLEDGLLPLRLLGPVLIDAAHGVLVAGARLRSAPQGGGELTRIADRPASP
jgi:predicted aspartyl protease